MKCKLIAGAMLTAFCLTAPIADAAVRVPENIYEWVQSSARADYYFNKQQMCFAVTEMGYIDLNTLIVPTVRMYDDVLIQDVQDKRRWKMLSLDGYDDLIGEADYLRFDLSAHTVTVTESDYLDATWSTLDASYPNQPIDIDSLPAKSLDKSFYQGILKYAQVHRNEILQQTEGELSPLDKKKLMNERKANEKTARKADKPA